MPDAAWTPAHRKNFTQANRPLSQPIRYIVVHVAQGSFAGTVRHFQSSTAKVSAHYVVRSSDGALAQCVRDADIAWHAGNWDYNTRSIGIEHEGYVQDGSYFTSALYAASAKLTAALCDRYAIPKTRDHVIGHSEVPGADHTDPGPLWDWNRYMKLVRG